MNRLLRTLSMLEYFINRSWEWSTHNTEMLMSELSPEDQRVSTALTIDGKAFPTRNWTIWLGELINKGSFSYIHRIIFLFGPRKSVNAINTMAGHRFNLGKRSSFLAFGQLLRAILQSGLISSVSLLCSPLVAVIFSTNPQCLCLSLPNICLQWKIIILWLSESLIHCSCQIKIILQHQSYSSFLPTF